VLEAALSKALAEGLDDDAARSWVERLLRDTKTLIQFQTGLRKGPPVEVSGGA